VREHTGTLTGWGGTAPTVARVVEADPAELPALLAAVGERGLIARGLGRSYGDAAQNAGGTVLAPLTGQVRVERDADGALLDAPAGANLHDLMRVLVADGLFVPVTPGTRYVTLGGAVACDIHGKNHHRVGGFGDHVVALDLLGADGVTRRIGPDTDPRLFWATVGGMGLTGVVTRVVLRLVPIETAYLTVHTERVGDLSALMQRMRESDDRHPYSVAWIDTMASGRSMGRSVLTQGRHTTLAELEERGGRRSRRPLVVPADPRVSVPVRAPSGLISRPTVRAFNELWFRKAPRDRPAGIESIPAFFHPLDAVADWNRLYGRRGLVQYQLVVPHESEEAMTDLVRMVSDAGAPSFLAVLKRFGPGSPGLLSFPMAGWTLALDVPTTPRLAALFARLDHAVREAGGRVYLAKDARLSPDTFAAMYPRLEEFRAVRAEVDPRGVFQSDLSRRLGI
jgi:decaprenylphospho-beta-D-ribofuranose 2-oxidase